MFPAHKQEKTSNPVNALGLTPSQAEHLLLGYLCISLRQVDWKKLAELSDVTPSSARTVFTRARRRLEKWEGKRTAGVTTKEADEAEEDEATEAAHAEDTKN